jgi:tryptophanyl-tRNA synthetase
MDMKQRVLSGMRPTGRLHLGNYLGAAKGMLALQHDPNFETYFTVVDIHATTTPFNPKTLRQQARDVYIDYLSVGLDPEKSAITIQSDLADLIAQLAFYFSSVVNVARMQHLPTFKEKVKQYPQNVTMALLNYPVLMAADILIYKASMVPVGIDQEPHLEVAREIARKLNAQYGLDFPEPERFATLGEYVPSLTGVGKMSKTVEGSYINLSDSLEEIKAKLAKVPTDSGKGLIEKQEVRSKNQASVHINPSTHEVSEGVGALMQLIELFQGKERRETYEQMYQGEGIRYGDLKAELAEAIFKELEPIQQKRKELETQPEYVDRVIADGAEKARVVATQTVQEVREKIGLA